MHMLRRMSASLLFVLMFAVAVRGQNYTPTDQDRQWVEARVASLQKMYALDANQGADLRKTATDRLPEQAAFQLDPTLNRPLRSPPPGPYATPAESKQTGR